MTKKQLIPRLLIAAIFIGVYLLLVGCADEREVFEGTVTSVGDCTDGTGGWGGESAKCRVTLEDGTRVTVFRPVDAGDRVMCFSPNFPCSTVR